MSNRIHLKGPYTHDEADAGEAGIYPGMLLKVASDGDVEIHDTEGGRAEALFATEDALQGNTIDTVYTVDNPVMLILPGLGCEVNALIAAEEDIAIGDWLCSNGDGCLRALGSLDSEGVDVFCIAVAMEACDLTASGAVNTLAAVRIVGLG